MRASNDERWGSVGCSSRRSGTAGATSAAAAERNYMASDRPASDAASLYRYEISALVGPCSMDEAIELLDRLSEREKSLGAAWGIQRVGEEEGYRFDD